MSDMSDTLKQENTKISESIFRDQLSLNFYIIVIIDQIRRAAGPFDAPRVLSGVLRSGSRVCQPVTFECGFGCVCQSLLSVGLGRGADYPPIMGG